MPDPGMKEAIRAIGSRHTVRKWIEMGVLEAYRTSEHGPYRFVPGAFARAKQRMRVTVTKPATTNELVTDETFKSMDDLFAQFAVQGNLDE